MQAKVHIAIGLMSGTSLDGVDAALIETDGATMIRPLGFVTLPYASRAREDIRACFGIRSRLDPKVRDAERVVTFKHIEAIERLLDETGRRPQAIDVIGFHGQTIFHAPKERMTVQIGDGALMARECGIDVVDDFRIGDVKAGGEGAPLAPAYHAARIRGTGVALPAAVLNIGGVANVTVIGEGADDLIAFDTGPGNALMDDWMLKRTGRPYDQDGACAAAGTADAAMIERWLAHPYFMRIPPKSLDRNEWDIAALGGLTGELAGFSTEDGAATLLEFTALSVARSVAHMKAEPNTWYACGGGRHNAALMARLDEKLHGALESVDDLGWNGDATEAECFAYLAVRSRLGLPISYPGTTAAPGPMTGGTLHRKP